MQSGRIKSKKWILEFETEENAVYPLMGWESSSDTMSEVKLEFPTKEQAIEWAIKNNYVSIVPCKFDLTSNKGINYLKSNWKI